MLQRYLEGSIDLDDVHVVVVVRPVLAIRRDLRLYHSLLQLIDRESSAHFDTHGTDDFPLVLELDENRELSRRHVWWERN